ncbi:hypothetical protein RM704_22885 [Streptomyces sp. DSM 3412]|uniref:Glycoside hydrolase family 3 N-terminal domain-containing protein n=1 Tax=Streptomyces gottesmaniae TaxID=3075518 RepID=A0ABU2Z125_9ACTN|nr:hypothetical protein [Streptomyces sp. DSM 3412]MDT0570283.1 hypothetical protein [Streptomyces sp. DSM 3412]
MTPSHGHGSAELSLDEKTALLSGQDVWTTEPAERVGIPSLVLSDGPHGLRRPHPDSDALDFHGSHPATCFPPAVALASSWDHPTVGPALTAAMTSGLPDEQAAAG